MSSQRTHSPSTDMRRDWERSCSGNRRRYHTQPHSCYNIPHTFKRTWALENLRRNRRDTPTTSPGRKSNDYIIQLVPASNAEVSIYKRKERPFEVPQLVKQLQTVSHYSHTPDRNY